MATEQENKENITASTAANFFHKKQYSGLQLILLSGGSVLVTAGAFADLNRWGLVVIASLMVGSAVLLVSDTMLRLIND